MLRRLARAGWTTREGFALAEPAWDLTAARLVLFGRVPDPDDRPAGGAGRGPRRRRGRDRRRRPATSAARCSPTWRRLGPVHRDPDAPSRRRPATRGAGPQLVPEQRALLERLANGETIAAAAAAEFLSLRTANRRIAQAREVLGVRTTREAVLAYLRPRGRPDLTGGRDPSSARCRRPVAACGCSTGRVGST